MTSAWQYHRANDAQARAAVSQAETQRIDTAHRTALKRLQVANAALRVESDRLATELVNTERDIDALLQTHKNWSDTAVPDAIVKRLRKQKARARGPPD